MAVHNGRIALAYEYLNRLAGDGTSGGLKVPYDRDGEGEVFAGQMTTAGHGSFFVFGVGNDVYKAAGAERREKIEPRVTVFGPFDEKAAPKRISTAPLPLGEMGMSMFEFGQMVHAAVDPWGGHAGEDGEDAGPTLWVVGRKAAIGEADVRNWGVGTISRAGADAWASACIRILAEKDGRWVVQRDFGSEVVERIGRVTPADHNSQRLYVNPKDGKLYVHEQRHPLKSFEQLVRIDPETGRCDVVDVPFEAEDMCFDINGLAYLRTDTLVVRYNPATWREVPWDYGEERVGVHFNSGRTADVISGLAETLIKFPAGKGKVISTTGRAAIPLTEADRPAGRPGSTAGSVTGGSTRPARAAAAPAGTHASPWTTSPVPSPRRSTITALRCWTARAT